MSLCTDQLIKICLANSFSDMKKLIMTHLAFHQVYPVDPKLTLFPPQPQAITEVAKPVKDVGNLKFIFLNAVTISLEAFLRKSFGKCVVCKVIEFFVNLTSQHFS